ncbi:CLUMA_CG006123, isoform A [Clunio marinus]|uniref:CLUMA_CG006123, isoform A n=1 Tax=Clunio marinus TaxID=568069 RepID=A0A1J1I2G7_9DIPT|nr:CLUMA_CG006123, isoform A [Clunio marinus]
MKRKQTSSKINSVVCESKKRRKTTAKANRWTGNEVLFSFSVLMEQLQAFHREMKSLCDTSTPPGTLFRLFSLPLPVVRRKANLDVIKIDWFHTLTSLSYGRLRKSLGYRSTQRIWDFRNENN